MARVYETHQALLLKLDTLKNNLRKIIAILPANKKAIMEWHYYKHKSFTEIAIIQGCSIGRVSQIHSDVIHSIRKRLEWI